MKPARSLNATRTKVAAPPVSRIEAVPSAYESATTIKSSPTMPSTTGVNPSACSAMMPSAKEIEAAGPERDEERADHEPAHAAAVQGGRDENAEAEHDDGERERERDPAIERRVHVVSSLLAATMTRQGACLSTKSTVSPKIGRLPRARRTRRGPPMTMISEPRRVASSTIARPALRARTMRSVTRTPYDSPIALASSSCAFASS